MCRQNSVRQQNQAINVGAGASLISRLMGDRFSHDETGLSSSLSRDPVPISIPSQSRSRQRRPSRHRLGKIADWDEFNHVVLEGSLGLATGRRPNSVAAYCSRSDGHTSSRAPTRTAWTICPPRWLALTLPQSRCPSTHMRWVLRLSELTDCGNRRLTSRLSQSY